MNESPTEEPKMWRPGDPYQYPIPEPNGDPWEFVLEALLKKDKVQCDAWKDEVQNLLIFAGLFSAVVTAFVVESCKSLRPDSSDLSVVLLARIAERLDTLANVTQQPFPLDPTSLTTTTSSSTIRVNIFWFLSLVLSLTTVLIGIVSLQWLREHQRYSDSLAPKQALGIFHMRAEALEQWHVPRVFASLPLLLQAALILFFTGIIDFLLSLSHVVATPVAIVLAYPILFIIYTTVVPTLQCFSASIRLPSSNAKVPSPCAYKSPQSLVFRRLVTSSRRLFMFTHDIVVRMMYAVQIGFSSIPHIIVYKTRKAQVWRYRLAPHRAYWFWAHRDWINFDRTWLILRNEHFDITREKRAGDVLSQPVMTEPVYDAVRGIAIAAQGNEYHDSVTFAVYHCFQDLARSTLSEDDEYPHRHLQASYRDLVPTWNSPIANIASMLLSPPRELLHDVHSVLFLRLPGVLNKAINPGHIFGKHMLELHTRILVHLYAEEPRKLVDGVVSSPSGFFHWYTINMAEADDAFLRQFWLLFASFMKTSANIYDDGVVVNTFHAHSDIDEFVSLASFLTWHTVEDMVPDGNRVNELLGTLDDIEFKFNACFSSERGDTTVPSTLPRGRPDFLFCCTTLYVNRLWQERLSTARVRTHSNRELIKRLILRFDHLQKDILTPYETLLNLENGRNNFSHVYSQIVPVNVFPSNFFSRTGRDFEVYGISCGLLTPKTETIQGHRHKYHEHGVQNLPTLGAITGDIDHFNSNPPGTQIPHDLEDLAHLPSSNSPIAPAYQINVTELSFNPHASDSV